MSGWRQWSGSRRPSRPSIWKATETAKRPGRASHASRLWRREGSSSDELGGRGQGNLALLFFAPTAILSRGGRNAKQWHFARPRADSVQSQVTKRCISKLSTVTSRAEWPMAMAPLVVARYPWYPMKNYRLNTEAYGTI